MDSCSVKLLGTFSVDIGDQVTHFPTQKASELFAFLLLAHKKVSREVIAAALWPEIAEDAAKRHLRTTLWRLRKVLRTIPDTRLETNAATILLDSSLQVDVARFEALVESIDHLPPLDQARVLQEAVSMYRGDLLEGRTYDWCEEQRRHFKSLYVRLLRHLARHCRATGDFRNAISYGIKLLEIDPSDEDAHRELMLLYHLSGDRDAALSQFGKLRSALQAELSVQPSQASIELWQYLQSQDERPVPSRALKLRMEEQPNGLGRAPLVGRQDALKTLMACMNQVAAGLGCAALVSGEAGIGKSTLVEVLAVEAGLRGFDLLQGSCPDLQDSPPYQVFVQALWPRITVAERESLEAPSALKVLLKVLTQRVDPTASPVEIPASGAFNSAIVNETLIGLLAGKYATKPTVLILENLHGIDKASSSLLVTLLDRLRGFRLLVIGTVREEEPGSGELLSRMVSVGATLVKLDPLSEAEVAELMRGILRSKNLGSDLVSYIWKHASGIPLFVIELVKFLCAKGFLARDGSGRWVLAQEASEVIRGALPLRINELIRRRLDMLDDASRRVLSAVAVFGPEISFDNLRELTDLPEDDLVRCTDRLVETHLLLETADGFRFPHESVRLVGISSIGKTQLRSLHLKAAEILELQKPWLKEDLAWHFAEAGVAEKALLYVEASGDKARLVHANANADEWYSKALRILEGRQGDYQVVHRRVDLLRKRQEVRELMGDRVGQAADVDAIDAAACELEDPHLRAEATVLRSNLLIRRNRGREAFESAQRAIQMFRTIGDMKGEARAREIAGLVHLSIRRYDLAQGEFRRVLSMYRSIRDRAGEARALTHLSAVLAFRMQNLGAIKCLDRAEVLLRELEDDRSRAMVLMQKGILYRFLGKSSTSEQLLQVSLDCLRRIGDSIGEARGLSQLALTHAFMGRLRDAVHESERALRIACRAGDVRAEIVILNNAAYGVFRFVGGFRRAQRYAARAMRLVAQDRGIENATPYADTMAAILLDEGQLEAANHWSEFSRSLSAGEGMRGTWIDLSARFTLGCICLERGQFARALDQLSTVRARLPSNAESEFELRTIAAMARAHVALLRPTKALECLQQMRGLLAKVDSCEKMQEVYWSRFRVLESCRNFSAAKRALHKAYEQMMRQMITLKGPMRRQFIAIQINARIAEAAGRVLGGRLGPESANGVPAARHEDHRKQAKRYREGLLDMFPLSGMR
jgi:DNA-binding SARP family transcriptional activator